MKEKEIFEIDLRKIEGDGSFPCPKCGVMITPDDETEKVYSILEANVEKDKLKEIVLSCNKCHSKIRLIGF